jgi:hypothetical protein
VADVAGGGPVQYFQGRGVHDLRAGVELRMKELAYDAYIV